jgi:hypothetical protein
MNKKFLDNIYKVKQDWVIKWEKENKINIFPSEEAATHNQEMRDLLEDIVTDLDDLIDLYITRERF